MKINNIITDFDCCPHCGGTWGYYTKVHTSGKWHDNTFWDHKIKENTEMIDSFGDTWESAWYYCCECNKKICKRTEI